MKQKAEMYLDMSLVRQTGEISVSDFRLFKKNVAFGRKIRVSAKICLQALFFCASIDFAWFRVNKIHAV